MLTHLRSATLSLLFAGACYHAPVKQPVFIQEQFAPYSAVAPKSKAELQTRIFDLALKAIEVIAKSEHGILLFDGKSWGPIDAGSEEDLNAVWGDKKGFVIVGTAGTILRGTPDGRTWKKVPSGVGVDLHKLWGDGEEFIAVGDRGTILQSSDGELWEPSVSGVKVNLHGIWGFGMELFVVGDEGTILHSTDDGETWKAQKSGVKTTLLDVWGYNNTKLYAVGEGGVILLSTNQGETWERQSSGLDITLAAARGRNINEIYVSGAGGTVLHRHTEGWNVETGFKLGGFQFEDTFWSRETHPFFGSMVASSDALFAIGGNQLWTFRSDREKSQLQLPLFPDLNEEIDTVVAPRFNGVFASASKTIVVGSQWHQRLLRQTREALALSDWTDAALHFDSVRGMYPKHHEISAAYALALLLSNDEAASYSVKRIIATFPRPNEKNPRVTDELAAALWFFIGENQASKTPKLAQTSFLISQWIKPSELAAQKIAEGVCVADINEKPAKATKFAGWTSLYTAIHKSDKSAPKTPDEAAAKKELCAKEPSSCQGAGPWLLKTTRTAISGKEEVMLSVVFPDAGGKLVALPDLYHSASDHTGIGDALLHSSMTIFKDGLGWLSLEGATFDVSGGEKTGILQEERFIDIKGKRQLFSLSQRALVQSYGQSPDVTREFLFPVEGKLDNSSLVLTGGGCDRKIKL